MSDSQPINRTGVFFALLTGQVASLIGTQLTGFGLGITILEQNNSVTEFSIFSFAIIMPGLALSPLAGTLVDRRDRRLALIFSHAASGCCSLTLAFLYWTGAYHYWTFVGIVALSSAFSSLQFPAFSSAISVLVDKKNLGRASGLTQFGYGFAQLVGPALGGTLLTSIELTGILVIDFCTFTLAISMLLFVSIPKPKITGAGRQAKGSFSQEMGYAWKYIRTRTGLLGNLILVGGMNLNIGMSLVLIAPLILSIATAAELGIAMSSSGLGMLVGGIAMTLVSTPKKLVNTIVVALLAQSSLYLALASHPSVVLITTAGFFAGITVPIIYSCSDVIWQRKVAPDMQGKVFSFRPVISGLPYPFGFLLAGPLTDHFFEPAMAEGGVLAPILGPIIGIGEGRGAAALFFTLGSMMIVLVLTAWCIPAIRNTETLLEDHNPLFGQMAINMGLLTEEEVADCLWWQKVYRRTLREHLPIGQIMWMRKHLSKEEVQSIADELGLGIDTSQFSSTPVPDTPQHTPMFAELNPTAMPEETFDFEELLFLGDVLVRMGYCSRRQLTDVLEVQNADAKIGRVKYLGELMVAENLITQEQLKEGLMELERQRKNIVEHEPEKPQ